MHIEIAEALAGSNNLKLVRRCLGLIRDIAGWGACVQGPEEVGYALQELTQVLVERTGSDERLFEPVPADQIPNLEKLLGELDFVYGCLQEKQKEFPWELGGDERRN